MKGKTRLGKGLYMAYAETSMPSMREFCDFANISYSRMQTLIQEDSEPRLITFLRAVKRASGKSWDEILGR